MSKRNYAIDSAKGFLILFVVLGHLIQDSLEDNFLRYLIYLFHMPLFIGISGFLFNAVKAKTQSFTSFIKPYLVRLVVPWVLAVLTYHYILEGNFHDVNAVFRSFIFPDYHLWFIPAYFSWVILMWCLLRWNLSVKQVLIIVIPLSVVCFALKEMPELYKGNGIIEKVLGGLLHTFRPFFLMFFVLSVYAKDKGTGWGGQWLVGIVILSGFGLLGLFFYDLKTLYVVLYYGFNSALLLLILAYLSKSNFRSSVLEWCGINSYGIYLWHAIAILLLQDNWQRTFQDYSISMFFQIFTFGVLFCGTKVKLINQYAFGIKS